MKKLKIVGTATCQFGGIVHSHDGDEMRANRCDDGGIFCVFCGHIGPSMLDALLNANGPGRAQLVRNDNGVARYEYTITIGPEAWVRVAFNDPSYFNDADIAGVNTEHGSDYVSPGPAAKFPACADKVAKLLSALGFRVVGDQATNTGGTMTMKLVRNLKPEEKDPGVAHTAITVQFSWLY